MKQLSAIIAVVFLLSAWAYKSENPKNYTVTLTLDQWQTTLQSLDTAQKVIISSDIPARSASSVNLKLSAIMQTIQVQVSQQLQAEQKADSAKPKAPKK